MMMTSPQEVFEARTEIGLTTEQAASLITVAEDQWYCWEADFRSNDYEQISLEAWRTFLFLTHEMRIEESKFRLRDNVLIQLISSRS